MLTYVVYCRRSQERDEKQVQSLESQSQAAKHFVQAANLTILEEIAESVSAKEPHQRDGFARLLKLIEQGKVQGIVAWHPDRLSRNEIDAASLTYLIRKGKLLDLKFANYTFDNSPEGVMMLQLALSQSQYFSSKLARDVKRGMDAKRDQGWYPHPAPQGYLNATQMQGYVPFKTIIPDEQRFPLIRAYWDLMLTDTYTVTQALAKLTDEWGYTTRPSRRSGGGPLSRAAAYKLLSNPFYTGLFRDGNRLRQGKHVPMVTPSEFARVQQILHRRGKPKPKKGEFAYTGLIHCATCRQMVTVSLKHGAYHSGTYVYYHCSNAKGLCTKRGLREDRLEMQLEEILRSIRIDSACEAFLETVIAKWTDYARQVEEDVTQSVEARLAAARRELNALLDLRLQERISDDVFSTKQAALLQEVSHLEQTVTTADQELKDTQTTARNAVTFRAHATEWFLVGSVHDRREIASALAHRYTFHDGVIDLEIHPVLEKLVSIELPISSSLSTKKTSPKDRVSFGAPEATFSEQLYLAVRGCPSFPEMDFLNKPSDELES